MPMNVVPYELAMAGELTSLYNELIRGVPHCHPVGLDEFAAALAPAAGEGTRAKRLHSAAAVVATEGTSILGFVHAAVERPEKEADAEQGVIRFLGYRRGRRAAGQLLLEAAEEHCRRHNLTQVKAFESRCRYGFYYLLPAHLSDRLDHVRALLQFNDYELSQGEVFLDWPDYEPVEPAAADVPAEIKVEWEAGRGQRPNVRVKAIRDGGDVGSCYRISDGESSPAAEAQDWLFVLELWVTQRLQGRRLGLCLLQRALKEAHAKG